MPSDEGGGRGEREEGDVGRRQKAKGMEGRTQKKKMEGRREGGTSGRREGGKSVNEEEQEMESCERRGE